MNSKLNERFVRHTAVPRAQVYPFVLALAFLFAACSNYQEEFDNNFGALEYVDDVDYSSPSGGDDPLPSSSDGNNPSSSSVPTSSSEEVSSSSAKSSSSSESSSSSIAPLSSYNPPARNYGELVYKGQKYRTATIGNQEWMAENMNAVVDGSSCYRDSSKYCDMYGRLYSWDAAMKVCPEGWRLPDTTDWSILFEFVGGKATAATHLKATTSWTKNGDGNGDDAFGFSALAAGGSDTGSDVKYAGKGIDAAFWTSEVKNSYDAWGVGMYWADSHPKIEVHALASNRRSVRCMKDAKPLSSSSAESSSSYVPPSGISYGKMTDPRTSTFSYRTVEIGNRTWMAENMAWQTTVSFCYGEDSHNCKNYGHLYSWEDAKNLCPDGWSLPSKEEWEELIKSVGDGSAKKAGEALKTNSGWKNDGNGTDEYGFSALPAGYWSNYWSDDGVRYFGLEGAAHFWSATATESGSDSAYGLKLEFNVDSAWMSEYSVTGEHYYALSVRCILDENYFVDNRDGKTYRKAKIGDQVWMAQNLNYKGPSEKDTIGYCYGNNSANCNKYGRLYTWATAMGSTEDKCGDGKNCDISERARGICPEGWHLPSNNEWQTLLEHADRDANKLKSTEGWSNGGNGTDDYGFTALPGGYAEQGDGASLPDDYFKDEGAYAIFWSSTQVDDEDHTQAYRPYLKDDNKVSESNSNNYKGFGFSVRCLKD
ncbi:fibrobacter succinogenes major paralogous domain-containing protein [Fibrobacter sp.]